MALNERFLQPLAPMQDIAHNHPILTTVNFNGDIDDEMPSLSPIMTPTSFSEENKENILTVFITQTTQLPQIPYYTLS